MSRQLPGQENLSEALMARPTHRVPRSRDHACQPPSGSQAGVVLQDPTGRVIVASQQASLLLGADRPEALADRPALFHGGLTIHPDGSVFPERDQPSAVALRTGLPQDEVVVGFRRSGCDTVWFRICARPLMKTDGTLPYAVASRFVRITARAATGQRPASGLGKRVASSA